MSMAPTAQAPAAMVAGAAPGKLRWFIFALFFIFGGITSLNDVLIPKLKHLFTLSYFEVMLVQSAFFAAYFLVSLPAAALVRRIGYMRSAAVGLLTMTAGCVLFVPASLSGMFVAFLAALFVLAAGITIVQVVANPLISMLGAPELASSRLTFAQGFNSLGTTIFPYVGAIVILGSLANVDPAQLTGAGLAAFRSTETQVIMRTYLGIAAALLVVAAAVWSNRHRLVEAPRATTQTSGAFALLRQPRFAAGTLAIFVYVGAEVSIGSLLVNFLTQADTLALGARAAGELIALYWGGAMIGRFIGAVLLARLPPPLVLLGVAIGAVVLLLIAAGAVGAPSGWALIAVGLCNSIMFPTIFTLASQDLGDRAAEGSGIICMAIVGGAIVPLVTGLAADAAGLRAALMVPLACYLAIGGFALLCRRLAVISR